MSKKLLTKMLACFLAIIMLVSITVPVVALAEDDPIPVTEPIDVSSAITAVDPNFTFAPDRAFRDPDVNAGARIDEIMSLLTLNERMNLTAGGNAGPQLAAVGRLGLPAAFNSTGATEAAHGVTSGQSTVFTNSFSYSKSWDDDLMWRVGEVIAQETLAGGSTGPWAPILDAIRHPLYGRAYETMGECPVLIGGMGTAKAQGMNQRTEDGYQLTRPLSKHFMGYNTQTSRLWVNSSMPLRATYEYHAMHWYLPINSGAIKMVMTSYPVVNSRPMGLSPLLWEMQNTWTPYFGDGEGNTGHFEMLNVDDFGSGSSMFLQNQRFIEDSLRGRTLGIANSIRTGKHGWSWRDSGVGFGAPPARLLDYYWEAWYRGLLTEEDINDGARRTLSLALRMGDIDIMGARNPHYINRVNTSRPAHVARNRGLTFEVSQSSIVLLKNEGNILPLSSEDTDSAVLLGMMSDTILKDYYTGGFTYRIRILDAMRNTLGRENVFHDRAVDTVAIRASNGMFLEGGTNTNRNYINNFVRAVRENPPTLENMKNDPASFEIYDFGFDFLIRTPVNDRFLQTTLDDFNVTGGGWPPAPRVNDTDRQWTLMNNETAPGAGQTTGGGVNINWTMPHKIRLIQAANADGTPIPNTFGMYSTTAGSGRNIDLAFARAGTPEDPGLSQATVQQGEDIIWPRGSTHASDADDEEQNDGSFLALNARTDEGRIQVDFATNGPWQNQANVLNSKVDNIPNDGMVDNLPANARFEFHMIQSAKEAALAQIEAAGPDAPIILVLGHDPNMSAREAVDKVHPELGAQSVDLINYLTNDLERDIILILKSNNPMAVQREVADNPGVKAILTMGHSGPEEGAALVSVLFDGGYTVPEEDWGPTRNYMADGLNVTAANPEGHNELHASYPGWMGPNGDGYIPFRSPAGRLTATWYDGLGQLPGVQTDADGNPVFAPPSYLWPRFDENTNNNLSNMHGSFPAGLQVYDVVKGGLTYKYFDGTPLFAFGHGLTYTEFAYSGVTVTTPSDGTFTVSGTVTNVGDFTSDEVVQVYSSFEGTPSRIRQPIQRLIAYTRLKDIAPGQSKSFSLDVDMTTKLGVYDVELQHLHAESGLFLDAFIVELGPYNIRAAGSSDAEGAGTTLNITAANGGRAAMTRNLNREVLAATFDDYSDIGGQVLDIEMVAASNGFMANDAVSFREIGAWINFKNVNIPAGTTALTARIGSDRTSNMRVYAVPAGADPAAALNSNNLIAVLGLQDTRRTEGLTPINAGIGPIGAHAGSERGLATAYAFALPVMETVTANVNVAPGNYDVYFVNEGRGARFELFKFGSAFDSASSIEIYDVFTADASIRVRNGTVELNAEVTPVTATDPVVWSLAPTDLAVINPQTGVLTATGIGNGTVNVTATSGSTTASRSIMITNQLDSNLVTVGGSERTIEYLQMRGVDSIFRRMGSVTPTLSISRAPEAGFPPFTLPGGDISRGIDLFMVAGVDFNFVALGAANATWTITDLNGDPTDLATVAANGAVTATGLGDGQVLVRATLNNNSDIFAERVINITNQGSKDAFTTILPIQDFDTWPGVTGLASPAVTQAMGTVAAPAGSNFVEGAGVVGNHSGIASIPANNAIWLFRDVDFGAGASHVYFRTAGMANATANLFISRETPEPGAIAPFLDEATPIGTVNLGATGHQFTYDTFGAMLTEEVSGVHDLYIQFTDVTGTNPLRVLFFQFDRTRVAFSGSNPLQLSTLFADKNVVLQTPGNLGIFAHHSPFVVPADRTLFIENTLNIQRDAELIIEGTVVVLDGGRINNQGGPAGFGTITIAEGGRLINDGYVENVSRSRVFNNGTLTNNARFEVRSLTWFIDAGNVDGSNPPNIHRDAVLVVP